MLYLPPHLLYCSLPNAEKKIKFYLFNIFNVIDLIAIGKCSSMTSDISQLLLKYNLTYISCLLLLNKKILRLASSWPNKMNFKPRDC